MGRVVDPGIIEIVADDCQVTYSNGMYHTVWTAKCPVGLNGETEVRVVDRLALTDRAKMRYEMQMAALSRARLNS